MGRSVLGVRQVTQTHLQDEGRRSTPCGYVIPPIKAQETHEKKEAVLMGWFRRMVDNLKADLKFYASKPDKRRKGGFGSKSKAIKFVREGDPSKGITGSYAGPRVWEQALDELGWD